MKIFNALTIDKMLIALALLIGGCSSNDEPASEPTPDPGPGPEIGDIHTYKAPLYWSVYEYCWNLERAGVSSNDMDITEAQWDKIINWVSANLKPYGYDMLCTDGFIPMISDAGVYMTRYGSMNLKKLVQKCAAKGLKVGVYDNPLWIHCSDATLVPGTNVKVGDLRYRSGDKVTNSGASDKWFSWIVTSHPGAKEYIDGFFKHYSEMGINFIRMDFLSWYEDGNDRGLGVVGRGYGRDCYEKALQYICESAKKYGIFTSLVMPHLYKGAELESKYGHMARIVADTGNGGWGHISDNDRRKSYGTWPNCNNQFDGFVYWSKVAGRGGMIMDGDFLRLNTLSTDAEREFAVSLQLMAGGPVTVADLPGSIGNHLKFYQNQELLQLNKDRFAGKPLSNSLIDAKNQIWYGQMSDGSWVVGIFNRDNSQKSFSVKLSELGIKGSRKMRDLWKHQDEGEADRIDVTLGAHACKIIKLN